MLNTVPTSINRLARNVVLNHPNTFNCKVFRETVQRVEAGAAIGGLPTMGGLGVLDAEDEEKIAHAFIGNGFALPAEGFAPAPMMGKGDANIGPADEFRFLIEPESESGGAGTSRCRATPRNATSSCAVSPPTSARRWSSPRWTSRRHARWPRSSSCTSTRPRADGSRRRSCSPGRRWIGRW